MTIDDFARDNDLEGVVGYLRSLELVGPDEVPDVSRLAGGRSNLTYVVSGARGRWVLRRPPASTTLPTAHSVAREHRIMSALHGTAVAVPRMVALCEDPAVDRGVPFIVMEHVDGVTVDGGSVLTVTREEDRAPITRAVVAQLAAIHSPEVATLPAVAGLGRPGGYLRRQVDRWRAQWDAATERDLADARTVATWLDANVPEDAATALVHGDFRIDNCILDRDDLGRVRAVVDWEMGTLGDPYMDLAMFLVYWVRPGDPDDLLGMFPTANLSRHPGFPSRGAIVAQYEDLVGRAWPEPRFTQALACFKLAAICEGIHARHVAGGTRGEGFEGYDARAEVLLAAARRVIAGDLTYATSD